MKNIGSQFIQDNTTVHPANFSVTALEGVFGKAVDNLPIASSQIPRFQFVPLSVVRRHCQIIYVKNSHSLQELKDNIRKKGANISRLDLRRVSEHFFPVGARPAQKLQVATEILFYEMEQVYMQGKSRFINTGGCRLPMR